MSKLVIYDLQMIYCPDKIRDPYTVTCFVVLGIFLP